MAAVSKRKLVWRLVPETKGRSLEEIQERWVVNGDRMLEEEHAA